LFKDSLEVVNNDRLATNVVTYNAGKSNYVSEPTSILSVEQAITASWVDVGTIVSADGNNTVNFLIELDINDSLNVRFRCVSNIVGSANDYLFSIYNMKASVVGINPEYAELEQDIDQNIILEYQTSGMPYLQLQVQAGTVGISPGIVKSLYSVKLWK
jgi:hypothetical protein